MVKNSDNKNKSIKVRCSVHSPFLAACKKFKNEGFRVCSLEDIAKFRLTENMIRCSTGIFSRFYDGPVYTRDGVLCIPGLKPKAFMIKDIDYLIEKYGVNENNEIYPKKEDLKKILQKSVKYPVVKDYDHTCPFRFWETKFDKDILNKVILMVFALRGNEEIVRERGSLPKGIYPRSVREIEIYPQSSKEINNKKHHKGAYIEPVTLKRDCWGFYFSSGIISQNNEIVYGIENNENAKNKWKKYIPGLC